MPKRPETQDTVLLALELLRRIPRQRKVSASELHEQLQGLGLQRDVRTIQRQLENLSRHFDIERDDRSKPYGYRWKEQAVGMALPVLTEQESLMLLLAQQQLNHLLPASLMAAMKGFFEQAHANLNPRTDRTGSAETGRATLSRDWLKKVRVVSTTQPLLPPKLATGVFEAVSNALYGNQWLDIVYVNAKGNQTQARVMPLGLAQQGPRLYLVCRFEGYDNERSLALHRFLGATVSGLTFERPTDFDLQAYDDDGRFGVSMGQRIRLQFTVTQDAGLQLLETPLSADQIVQIVGDDYLITATVVETLVLHRWLKGFGEDIRRVVITPLKLNTQLN
jgi:predicted DNA-binding transcriptional regulator YafY